MNEKKTQICSGAEFTEQDRQKLRHLLLMEEQLDRIVVADERATWLWAIVRRWGAYIAGVIIFVYTVKDWIIAHIK